LFDVGRFIGPRLRDCNLGQILSNLTALPPDGALMPTGEPVEQLGCRPAEDGMAPLRCNLRDRRENKGAFLYARMRQHRGWCRADEAVNIEEIEVKNARSPPLAPATACLSLDTVEQGQQGLGRKLAIKLRHGINKIRLVGAAEGCGLEERRAPDHAAVFAIEPAQGLIDRAGGRSPPAIDVAAECDQYHAT
jgi:hypothetical protein